MQKKGLRLGLFAFSGFLIVLHVLLFRMLSGKAMTGAADLASFYATSSLVKTGLGNRIYDLETQTRIQARLFPEVRGRKGPLFYVRPPFQVLLYLPLTCLSYRSAYALWAVANLLLLLLIPRALGSVLADLKAVYRPLPTLIFLTFFPAFDALLQGQDSILLLLLFTLAFLALRFERELLCGCLLGLGLFKFQIVLPFLFHYVLRRRWKLLLGFSVVFSLLLVASAGVTGLRGLLGYPVSLLETNCGHISTSTLARGNFRPEAMPNLRGAVYCLGLGGPANTRTKLAGVALLSTALLIWSAWRWPSRANKSLRNLDLEFALNVIVALVVSFHLYLHDLTLLALPIALVANRLARPSAHWTPSRMALLGLLVAFFLTPLYALLNTFGKVHLLFWALLLFLLGVSRELSETRTERKGLRRPQSLESAHVCAALPSN